MRASLSVLLEADADFLLLLLHILQPLQLAHKGGFHSPQASSTGMARHEPRDLRRTAPLAGFLPFALRTACAHPAPSYERALASCHCLAEIC